MHRRPLGRTGDSLSLIGFGGIVVRDVSTADAAAAVAEAVELGINYFDVAPIYGNAEEMLGPALRPYRDSVFLACKTEKRDAAGARAALERSLRLLQTDHFDLYQFHGVPNLAEAEQILAPGGAMEAVLRAREEGKLRHIGFSAHSEAAALRLLDAFEFDSVLYPVSRPSWDEGGFGPRLVARALERGAGILALKALAARPLAPGEARRWSKCWYEPIDTLEEAIPALAFTLSQPVTSAIPPGHLELLRLACEALDALGDPPWPLPSSPATGAPLFRSDV